MTTINTVARPELHRLTQYLGIADNALKRTPTLKRELKEGVPWLSKAAGPSTWTAYGLGRLPVYVLELDVTRISPSQFVKNGDVLHDIETAARRVMGVDARVRWKNHKGLGLVFDERPKTFPDLIPLPAAPKADYLIPFGVDTEGRQYWRSLRDTQNILVAGMSRKGKTTGIRSWLRSLTEQHSPAELRLAVIDGKDYDLLDFEGSPYLLKAAKGKVATDVAGSEALTHTLFGEVLRRRKLLKKNGLRSIAKLNKRLEKKGRDPLPVIVLIVDELSALIDAGMDPAALWQIARQGLGMDVYIILSLQRGDAGYVKKTNFATTVAYQMANTTESQAVFTIHQPFHDLKNGGPGELIALGPDMNYLHLKGFYVDLDEDEEGVEDEEVKADAPPAARTVNRPTRNDRIVAQVALAKFNGSCAIRPIHEAARENLPAKFWRNGGLFTVHNLQKRFKRWEQAGWLLPAGRLPTGKMAPRQISPVLKKLL